MAEIEKTKRFIKYLICLFAAATVLILTGGAKMAFGSHVTKEGSAEIGISVKRYLPFAGDQEGIASLAEKSPEFLLYLAGGSTLRSIGRGSAE